LGSYRVIRPLLAAVGICVASSSLSQTIAANNSVSPSDPLATLKPGHPRLLVSEADWGSLRSRSQSDPDLANVVARIEADARWLLGQPPLRYQKQGKRLLDISRQAIERIMLWSVTYHLTGDRAYAERARAEMLNLAALPDWNPSHFLDTAEMTTAMAFGYDWLYDELDPPARQIVCRAIVEKGLEPGLAATGQGSWHQSENNWNQVCFGGLTLGALAIAGEEPEPARRLLAEARTGIAAGLRPYAPDGVYPEGPGYWGYGTEYQTLMLAALQTALGTQWNLDASPGFLSSAAAQLQLTGPSGDCFNYFDCGPHTELQPAMFWFANRLRHPALLYFQRKPLRDALGKSVATEADYHENRLFSLIALWWCRLPDPGTAPNLPLVWHGRGPNPVGVFRTSWSDTNALFLAFKGGQAGLSHGHMDAGSFVLEADGVRWALDLGRQDYLSLESKGLGIWSYGQDSERWRVFRLNNFSHNTLTIGGQLHRVDGAARITDFHDAPAPQATVDLSPVFAGEAKQVHRQFALGTDRTVFIRDEVTGVTPGKEVRWAMVTKARIGLSGTRATLKQAGKILQARLLSPADAVFSVIPADPPGNDYDAPNPDTRILIVKVRTPPTGEIHLTVALRPGAAIFPSQPAASIFERTAEETAWAPRP